MNITSKVSIKVIVKCKRELLEKNKWKWWKIRGGGMLQNVQCMQLHLNNEAASFIGID